jgi:2-polyprenyl-3-methyl-5-hydroxy-6-metoxy-1,4-benzoquinol methylase/uncharacterized protein YbaR (Trm112 family)
MRANVDFLVCTECKSGNLASKDGFLQCSNCQTTFNVVGGIPRFVPDDGYARSFGFQWGIHAQTQLDSCSGKEISRRRLFEATNWSDDLSGQTILEAGSGAGRFTEVLLKTGAALISFDLSSAVESNYRSNGASENLLLVQASIFDIPVRSQSMDKVICLGVLQHTPDPKRAFLCLANCVRPGGELVVDVYAARLRSLLSWKYMLRPITKRMDDEKLYGLIARITPRLKPISDRLYRILGHVGLRLLPIANYPMLGLSPEQSLSWAILDTFDMYSPRHDHPQTLAVVQSWFEEAGFHEIEVRFGLNGIVGRGRMPL